MKKVISLFLLIITLILSACAPKQAMLKADILVAQGEYKQAANFSKIQIDSDDIYARNNLLWELQTGSSLLFSHENNSSIKHLDQSELLIKHYQEQALGKDVTQTISSTLLNDTTRPYTGTQYDAIMLNTYKAINYLAKGDTDGARVEFNRVIDRQRRAKIYFNEMIQKEQKAIKEKEAESLKEGKNLKVENSQIDIILEQNYPSLHSFEAYPDFVNPMSTYLAGLFAKANKETNKAHSLLKEAYGMMPQNRDVQKDFEEEENEPMVWLIYENGQAPILEELRMDFPIWIFSDRLSYISIALPKLTKRGLALAYLSVVDEHNKTVNTQFLCSMDRVIETEFSKNYPSIVGRAILSTATKTAINYALQKSVDKRDNSGLSLFVGVATALYQIASTQADTRIWTTLPKEFQLARFKRPDSGKIDIKAPNGVIIESLDLPKRDNILIYIKIATPYAKASVSVMPF